MFGNTLVIVNPAARSGKATQVAAQVASVLDRIKAASSHELEGYTFHYTIGPKDATTFVTQEGNRYHTVLAIGGDGLVNEVINGLMTIDKKKRPRFGLVPCGNGDDFARTISLPRNPAKTLQQIESRALVPKRIDLARANNHWYAETLSFGLDASIALGTQELRKKTSRTGTSLYLQCGLDRLKNHRDIHEVTIALDDDEPRNLSCYLLAIQNGISYGGGFKVCPQAKINDGLLDICYVSPPLSFKSATTLFVKATKGKHIGNEHIHFMQAKRIQLQFAHTLPAQIDGEYFSDTNVTVEVFPSELETLMP